MNKVLVSIFLFLIMSSSAKADSFSSVSDYRLLQKLVKQNDFVTAWQLAQKYSDEYLGDEDFDFLYGLSALNTDNLELAVFAFERVVTNKPNWLDSQYYLAVAYFKIANYQGTITLAEKITKQEHATEKLAFSARNLQQMAEKKLAEQSLYFHQFANVSVGHDSNINAGIDEENIYLPFLGQNIALSEASKENSDNYMSLNYHINGSKALNQKSKILFSSQVNHHHFITESDFNRTSFAASADYWQEFNAFNVSVGVKVQPLWFDGSYYRNQMNINAEIEKQLNQQWLITGRLAVGKTKNNENDTLSTDDLSVSLNSQYIIGRWRQSLSYTYLEEMSKESVNEHISKKSSVVSYNNIWLFSPKWIASGALSWQHQAYQDLHPFYFTKRVDDMWLVSAMLQFQHSKEISYRLNINVQEKDSNLALFSYQRVDIGLTANLSF